MNFIKPFLTLTLCKYSGKATPDDILNLLQTELSKVDSSLEWNKRESGYLQLPYAAQFYEKTVEASWCAPGGPYVDLINGFFSAATSLGVTAFHFSESDLKEKFIKIVDDGALPGVTLLSAPEMNYIFIKDKRIKALWLYGIHQRSTVKVDSKTVFGQDLVDSIDLIGDQTYACSAARSQVSMNTYEKSVGVSPEKASIWISQTDNWPQFMSICTEVISYVHAHIGAEDSPIHTLPSPAKDLSKVSWAYDFDVLTSAQLPGQFSQRLSDLSEIVHAKYDFEITPGSLSSATPRKADLGANFSVDVYELIDGARSFLGRVDLTTSISSSGKLKFSETLTPQPQVKWKLVEFSRVFKNSDLIRVWFESGHVYTASRAYQVNYRDVEFRGYKWLDFSSYNVTKEKPLDSSGTVDLSLIGNDDSLFCWLKNEWELRAAPALWGSWSPIRTWIACDDGAGEKSDFIVVSEFANRLHVCFAHIKAAKSLHGTRISVGAHDVVLNQSIKNIRYANYAGFSASVSKMSGSKKVWLDGTASGFASFSNFVSSNKKKIDFTVLVIQPHTRKSFYTSGVSSLQKNQLDTLIINAKNVVGSTGAEFIIAGQDA